MGKRLEEIVRREKEANAGRGPKESEDNQDG